MRFAVAGPAGVGKKTLIQRTMARLGGLYHTVSCTTRDRREGEVEGVDYFFKSEGEFERMRERGEFHEWERVHGRHLYGTLVSECDDRKVDVIIEADCNGVRKLKPIFPQMVTIFVLPPNPRRLETQLRERGREKSEEEIRRRLHTAEIEVAQAGSFDCWIENDNLDKVVAELCAIITLRRRSATAWIPFHDEALLTRIQSTFNTNLCV